MYVKGCGVCDISVYWCELCQAACEPCVMWVLGVHVCVLSVHMCVLGAHGSVCVLGMRVCAGCGRMFAAGRGDAASLGRQRSEGGARPQRR